jgi:parallel beta-helix repeat protein
MMRDNRIKAFSVLTIALFAFGLLALPTAARFAEAASCVPAGSTGLTAFVVASSGQTVSGTIDATGCDVGVYVGPGTTGVRITGATISGANDHGIFVQDVSGITIKYNTVTGNGVNPNSAIAENKAVELVGTSFAVVEHNTVSHNVADGGIGVADDGAIDPGAPNPGNVRGGSFNLIAYNEIDYNLFGCGIVIAAYNTGSGVSFNTVKGNTVLGASFATVGELGPAVGGIVVAADVPNTVADNTISGSLIPGVVVHSNAPGDVVTMTFILNNKIDSSGDETDTSAEPPAPNGIMVVAEAFPGMANPPTITFTFIIHNSVNNDYYGVWSFAAQHTIVAALSGNSVVPVTIR